MKRVAVELQSGCIFISGAVEFDDTWSEAQAREWLAARSLPLYDIKKAGNRIIPEVDFLVEQAGKVCCV